MKTEREKMVAGELYDAQDPDLVAGRARARLLLNEYNATLPGDADRRRELLDRLLGRAGPGLWIEPPFYCDYGANITFGRNVYLNFNCVILDVAPVAVGDDVMFGPAVQVYTATHPLDWAERAGGLEFGRPIAIGANVWVGGGAILLPGVTIGPRTVIGAGSVVTRDLPAGVFAAGNPCRVVKALSGPPPA